MKDSRVLGCYTSTGKQWSML